MSGSTTLRERKRESETLVGKKISATGWGPASAQPARPHRPAICPAVLSVFQTLPSANIWITSHPYGKGGEGGRQANTNLILLSSPFLIAQDLRRVIITGEGDPLLWSTISEGIDNWTGGGKNFCFKDADACTGPYLISLWDLLTSRGSVMFLTPEQGEGKTERGGGGGEEGKDGGEASPSLLLKCYRRLCPFHWRGILSLSPLLFCFSSHLNSGKPEGYRQRAKHSGFMHICTHSHKHKHTHTQACCSSRGSHTSRLLSPSFSFTFLSCPTLMSCLHLHDHSRMRWLWHMQNRRRREVREVEQFQREIFGKLGISHTLTVTLWSPPGECADIQSCQIHSQTQKHW